MTGPRRLAVLALCVTVAVLTAWYAGTGSGPSAPPPAAGSVRLGPDAGEAVPAYLARLPADLPPPGVAALALVQFEEERTAAEAVALVAGAAPVSAVLRVPLPRVQTALRFQPVETGVPIGPALSAAGERARLAARADAARLAGRPAAVAAAEAAGLADPDGRWVLALLVRADRSTLEALVARPGVRAVQAAPPAVTAGELALAPLLPGQVERAGPLPDDGPVPAA